VEPTREALVLVDAGCALIAGERVGPLARDRKNAALDLDIDGAGVDARRKGVDLRPA
jgi:hypothetical protein